MTELVPFVVALVVPLTGPASIYAPSCVLCAQLATEEINVAGGLLGRPVRLRIVDGSGDPELVAAEVDRLVSRNHVAAIVGWHISAVRRRVAPTVRRRVPYIYTALHEGDETTPGVLATGETPDIQLRPALGWLSDEIGVRKWFVVGNDYVWPRQSAVAAAEFLHGRGTGVVDMRFAPLGTADFRTALDRIGRSRATGVLMLLVGRDAVAFHRQFAELGLEDQCARFSPLMDETMLAEIGPEASRDVFSASGYFEALPTSESLAFGSRYSRRFGPGAPPLGGPGESCYTGLLTLVELVRRTGRTDGEHLARVDRVHVASPRGPVHVDASRASAPARQRVYMATADRLGFDVLDSL
ncbi:substrate-binding domain-containing protein [Pseudonocardia sp. N23]|uniref:substrate-binding domain-containing protein n=1 Tax=Pseudonocardia sp. N23 TaxID=1987376 RepID=UPI000BFDCAF9|nr:substrate-binding domain-containing protein [Pseudonocardia sp. N23]GAY07386.1 putative nitrile hydratase regulator clustered with urea transport [Pseudonocardia sp. N23]